MRATIVTKLERPAKKGGGDRYAAVGTSAVGDDASTFPIGEFMVYIPQSISRSAGSPAQVLTLTISDEKGEASL